MVYADFAFYTDDFLGNTIAGDDFPRLALRASERIDAMTRGRAEAYFAQMPDSIAKATCAVAEILQQAEFGNLYSANTQIIQSETVGKHHVTYAVPTSTMTENGQRAIDKAILNTVSQYLARTGLLYRGVAMC